MAEAPTGGVRTSSRYSGLPKASLSLASDPSFAISRTVRSAQPAANWWTLGMKQDDLSEPECEETSLGPSSLQITPASPESSTWLAIAGELGVEHSVS
jgi:hypothetical protein